MLGLIFRGVCNHRPTEQWGLNYKAFNTDVVLREWWRYIAVSRTVKVRDESRNYLVIGAFCGIPG